MSEKKVPFPCRGPIGTRTPRTPDSRVHVFVSTAPNAEMNGGEKKDELDLGRRAMRHLPISTRARERGTETQGRREALLQFKAVLGPWWGLLKKAF